MVLLMRVKEGLAKFSWQSGKPSWQGTDNLDGETFSAGVVGCP